MRRARYRRERSGLNALQDNASRHCVRVIILGKLRAQQMPLNRQDALCLLAPGFGGRTGLGHEPAGLTLRHAEQHERQRDEKPGNGRAPDHSMLSWLRVTAECACHPWAAHT